MQTMLELSRGDRIHSRVLLNSMTEGGVSMENRDWFMPEPGLEVLLITATSMLVSRTSNVAGAGLPAREARLSVWSGGKGNCFD